MASIKQIFREFGDSFSGQGWPIVAKANKIWLRALFATVTLAGTALCAFTLKESWETFQSYGINVKVKVSAKRFRHFLILLPFKF